jgi:hypothetical protein
MGAGSFDTFDRFNFFNSDIFDFSRSSPENPVIYRPASLAWGMPCSECGQKAMLKISIFDTQNQRRLVVEGKLIAPWAAELSNACARTTADLQGREFMIHLKNLTAISEDGEKVLLELMKTGVRFRASGVFTKHVVKRLAREIHRNDQEAKR